MFYQSSWSAHPAPPAPPPAAGGCPACNTGACGPRFHLGQHPKQPKQTQMNNTNMIEPKIATQVDQLQAPGNLLQTPSTRIRFLLQLTQMLG